MNLSIFQSFNVLTGAEIFVMVWICRQFTWDKVLFAIKCRERYIVTVLLAIDSETEMKTSNVVYRTDSTESQNI